jgi:CRISPR-associated protein Csa3
MRTYLAPLGFDSRRVVRPVLSEGIDEDDEVVLFQPSDNSERGQETLDEVREVLTQVVPNLSLENRQLPYTDFVETTLACAEQILAAEGETIVVLGGGAREILLPLTVATFSTTHSIDTVLQVGDIDGSVRRVPKLTLSGDVSPGESDFLQAIAELPLPLSISEIAEEVGKSKSTVARHVKRLEAAHLVRARKDGRNKDVEVTDSGRVYLATHRRSPL